MGPDLDLGRGAYVSNRTRLLNREDVSSMTPSESSAFKTSTGRRSSTVVMHSKSTSAYCVDATTAVPVLPS